MVEELLEFVELESAVDVELMEGKVDDGARPAYEGELLVSVLYAEFESVLIIVAVAVAGVD